MVVISDEDALSARVITMETAFWTAVKSGQIPGAVIMARDFSGTLKYTRCFGARTVVRDECNRLPPFQPATLCRLASATKLLTTIMALQCVERGLVTLDRTVNRLLPDLNAIKVLEQFNAVGGLRRKKGTIKNELID
ncbi:beta-lactamase/transpeptidase-like protein [Aspergillus homomorphus CBS 101889]|uniref:Beta-lactamase/transpeptidase-like protein n=1 Tax=Aspergillus homomorphus (strain CBS 101889) TaxID=1450537 RepID=A0A395HFX4_ASPHC|nr:beta-lactamase/transpeptidase-like protein [Aspergillus homomorphus CBS 101889]RAL06831.1 beta-lactamase/transpeptidase-like protein [Aspergillus homomorphus CBS 101889]